MTDGITPASPLTATWQRRLAIALAAYLAALLTLALIGGFFTGNSGLGFKEFILFTAMWVLSFPNGFGYGSLDSLGVVPHLTYAGLVVALARTAKPRRFWLLFAVYSALLASNIYGCVHSPRSMS